MSVTGVQIGRVDHRLYCYRAHAPFFRIRSSLGLEAGFRRFETCSVSTSIDISRPTLKIYSENGGGGAEKRPSGSVKRTMAVRLPFALNRLTGA
jgi:hypothetical protein